MMLQRQESFAQFAGWLAAVSCLGCSGVVPCGPAAADVAELARGAAELPRHGGGEGQPGAGCVQGAKVSWEGAQGWNLGRGLGAILPRGMDFISCMLFL